MLFIEECVKNGLGQPDTWPDAILLGHHCESQLSCIIIDHFRVGKNSNEIDILNEQSLGLKNFKMGLIKI